MAPAGSQLSATWGWLAGEGRCPSVFCAAVFFGRGCPLPSQELEPYTSRGSGAELSRIVQGGECVRR
jgi:hypothetical protein